MWIKICGIRSLEDAETAVSAGADAIGFVFAESPRRITPQAVRSIVRDLPSSVEKIGVFVDGSMEEMAGTCESAGLTGLQMHGTGFEPEEFRVPGITSAAPLRLIWTVRFDGDSSGLAQTLGKLRVSLSSAENRTDAILVDTWIANKRGGSGVAFDWLAAHDSFFQQANPLRLIAAGGLRPENVGEAIRILRPWGVDVSSGVEVSPGKKDPDRIREFVRAARQATSELTAEESRVS